MKNTIKKITALLISAILMLSVLTACGQQVTLLDFMEQSSDKTDLEGYVCKLGMSTQSDNTGLVIDKNNPFGYKENTQLADAVIARLESIEKELNCEIELSLIGVSASILYSQLFADNVKQEVLYSPSHALTKQMAATGFLEKVNNYGDYIDYTNTEKYGDLNIQIMNAVKGDIYAVAPITWMFKQPRALELIVINEDLRDQYNTPRIQEYIENGTWNWDAFEEFIANSSYHGEEKNVYSLATRGLDMIKLLAYGNGYRLVYETADGYATDFGADNMVEAVQFEYDLRKNYSENFTPVVDWPSITENFVEQKNTVACITSASILYNEIVYEVKNYSVAPFPTGPHGEYGKWPSAIEATETFSVFTTGVNPEPNFRIIDMICEPLEGFETEEARLDYLSTNVVFTVEDAEYALNIHKNGTYTEWYFGFDLFWASDFQKKGVSVVIDEYKDSYPALIEEYLVPNFPVYDLFSN